MINFALLKADELKRVERKVLQSFHHPKFKCSTLYLSTVALVDLHVLATLIFFFPRCCHSGSVVKLLPARGFNLKLTFNVSHQLGTRAEKWNADNVDRMWLSSKDEA